MLKFILKSHNNTHGYIKANCNINYNDAQWTWVSKFMHTSTEYCTKHINEIDYNTPPGRKGTFEWPSLHCSHFPTTLMTYITAYQLVMTRNMIFRVTRDDKVHHVDSGLSWKLLCSLTLKTKNVLRSKPGDEGRFCSWRLVYNVEHLESKECLRIQPARLFNCSWWVMWCVQ